MAEGVGWGTEQEVRSAFEHRDSITGIVYFPGLLSV